MPRPNEWDQMSMAVSPKTGILTHDDGHTSRNMKCVSLWRSYIRLLKVSSSVACKTAYQWHSKCCVVAYFGVIACKRIYVPQNYYGQWLLILFQIVWTAVCGLIQFILSSQTSSLPLDQRWPTGGPRAASGPRQVSGLFSKILTSQL
jgi:hypothetical protein